MDIGPVSLYLKSMPWANYIVERGTYDEDKGLDQINWCKQNLNGRYWIGYFIWFELLEDQIKYILKWM